MSAKPGSPIFERKEFNSHRLSNEYEKKKNADVGLGSKSSSSKDKSSYTVNDKTDSSSDTNEEGTGSAVSMQMVTHKQSPI